MTCKGVLVAVVLLSSRAHAELPEQLGAPQPDQEEVHERTFAPPQSPPSRYRKTTPSMENERLAAVVVGGTSLALIGVSIYLGVHTQNLTDEIHRQPHTPQAISAAHEHPRYLAAAATVGSVGAAGLVAGCVLAYFGWREVPLVTANVTPSGATFGVAGTW